jgi:hypothetical protein
VKEEKDMKKMIIAAMAAAAATCAVPAADGEAATKVKIYLGVPHYATRLGPDYFYRNGYGWYRPAAKGKISCERARNIVRNQGFRNVDRVECNGPTYTFRGTRNGKRYAVYVNARTGGVWR